MIVEVLKLIAEKGPIICAAYSRIMRTEPKSKPKSKLTIRYMSDEETMLYLISTKQ